MAEINLCSLHRVGGQGGPDIPGEMAVIIKNKEWPGGGTTPTIEIFVGNDTISIWPAFPDHIEELGKRLIVVAEELRSK